MMDQIPYEIWALFSTPLTALAASVAISIALTGLLIRFLKKRQLGKAIREDGPDHQSKAGTPTMGGIGMLVMVGIALIAGYLVVEGATTGKGAVRLKMPLYRAPIAAIIGFAALGLADDLAGLARRSGKKELGIGLRARDMLAIQTALAFIIAAYIAWVSPLHLPFLSESHSVLATLVSIPLLVLIIVGTANGVNLSDGLDGLAAGLLSIAFLATSASIMSASGSIERAVSFPSSFTGRWDENQMSTPYSDATGPLAELDHLEGGLALSNELLWMNMTLVFVSLVAAGACLGFLFHNRFPAKVFMGNVASMGLGVTFAMIHILSGTWWLIPIIGTVFMAEVVSDLIQIGYFKYSGGVRVFRMAPLHHHYEKGGMPEQQVVRRFWAAGLVSGIAGIALSLLVAALA